MVFGFIFPPSALKAGSHPTFSLLGFSLRRPLNSSPREAPRATWDGLIFETSIWPARRWYIQEIPKKLPGVQISWYFEPFWSPGALDLHFEVLGFIFQEAPKRLPGGQISWYFDPFWSPGAPGPHFEVQGFIFQEAPKKLPGGQISWYFDPFWLPGTPGLHFEVQGSISSSWARQRWYMAWFRVV